MGRDNQHLKLKVLNEDHPGSCRFRGGAKARIGFTICIDERKVKANPLPAQKAMLQILARAMKRTGYGLIRSACELPAHLADFRHAPVLPVKATYSPWLTDKAFQTAYWAVSENTLVDQLRCYELWSLVGQASKLGHGAFLEVGVWRGGTGCLIAQSARHFGSAEPVYLCDTFSGVVKAGNRDTRYKGGEHSDTHESLVEVLAQRLDLPLVKVLKGTFPDDTAHAVGSNSFCFAHLDVDVYESTKQILEWLWPRLLTGGVLVFDDYGTYGCEGVTQVVNEFIQNNECLMVHNLNGHAVVLKTDRTHSFHTQASAPSEADQQTKQYPGWRA